MLRVQAIRDVITNPPLRPCCAALTNAVVRVGEAVKRIFTAIWQFFVRLYEGCRNRFFAQRELPRPVVEPFVRVGGGAQEVPLRPLPPVWRWDIDGLWGRPAPVERAMPPLDLDAPADAPIDLAPLREALRNGRHVSIPRNMTALHFCTLIEEFPREKERIGEWAIQWAAARQPKLDPTHPYYEIAQDALRLKDQLRGYGHSEDLATYRVDDEMYHGDPQFPLIIKSIISLKTRE